MGNQTSNAPIEVIRDGAIKASIWSNESENGEFLTTTFARTYTDANGDPKDTSGFTGRDLLVVSELARQAWLVTNAIRSRQSPSADR
ncbi:hypothetical protein [Cerasicoccus frondis]|uniref:hypothetical protein n=1 Tax=Cerasicoccus frondis TaxID=490090 RepID=UPI002852D280|nr:hypothetical protein [Cerasicoccus frondis]